MGFKVIGIGGTAFWKCEELTEVVVPDDVNYIEEQSFYGCSKLSAITLPKEMNTIGYEAFSGCKNLTEIVIPEGVEELCATFYGCTSLSEIQLPSTLKQLTGGGSGWLETFGVFGKCEQLSSVVLPYSLTSIGEFCFSGCKALASVNIPDGVTSIGGGAFYGCSSLEDITLPSKLISIDSDVSFIIVGAFESSGIKSITIPASVTEIGPKAFAYCPNLVSITVDKRNTVYDSREDCNAIVFTANDSLVVGCKSTVIPNTVKKLGPLSFYGVTGLTQISIPKSVVSVGGNPLNTSLIVEENELQVPAIVGCESLERIIVEEGNTVYDSRENSNAIIETATNKLIIGTSSTTVPKSVTTLGYSSICNGRPEFVIPKHIKAFEPAVFGDGFIVQSPIIGVAFEEGTKEIPTKALYENSMLAKLTIPSTVTSIGDRAFAGCNSLQTVISYIKDPSVIDYSSFDRYNMPFASGIWENATLYVPKGTKELYEQEMIDDFDNFWSYFRNIVEMNNGDANGDGTVDVADIAYIISVMSGSIADPSRMADVNGDGTVNVADIAHVIRNMTGNDGE